VKRLTPSNSALEICRLLAGSFAIWGINDIFRGFGRTTLAKIGDAEIPIDRFRQNYQDRLQQIGRELGRPLPADRANALGLDRQVLGEMIAQAGLDQRVRQMGLAPPEQGVAAESGTLEVAGSGSGGDIALLATTERLGGCHWIGRWRAFRFPQKA
jgi:hypothetical protein